MPIKLTPAGMRGMLPRAPQDIIDAFVEKQQVLDRVGVTETRQRLAYFFGNIEHECGGFALPNLTENINYTAERMAQVWPNRFKNANAVRAKYGTAKGWQKRAFDDIYGNRMGNRPGTNDGSTFIGRGGPQWTGRDGYKELESRTMIAAVARPELAATPLYQPEVCAAFWDWKGMNRYADSGNFKGCVKAWNGGNNGMADRLERMEGNDPFIKRMEFVKSAKPVAGNLPGGPSTADPPQDVIDDATKSERTIRNATGAAGAATVGAKASTEQPNEGFIMPAMIEWSIIGAIVAVAVISAVLAIRKKKIIQDNWF